MSGNLILAALLLILPADECFEHFDDAVRVRRLEDDWSRIPGDVAGCTVARMDDKRNTPLVENGGKRSSLLSA